MIARGYTMDKDEYLTRLRKIEGQVRGLQRMIENDERDDKLTEASRAIERLLKI